MTSFISVIKASQGSRSIVYTGPFISPCTLGGHSHRSFPHTVDVWKQKAVVVPKNLHVFAHRLRYTHFHMWGRSFLECSLENFFFFVKSCVEGYLASIARDTM